MRLVRVGVDARHLAGHRGVAHYTTALLSELARLYPEDEWVLFLPGRRPLRVVAGPGGGTAASLLDAPNVNLRRHAVAGRALFGAAALTGRPRLDRMLGGGLDVLWSLAPAPLALSPGVPFALTVHDLSFVDRPSDFTPYERLWHRLARPRRLVGRATRVIAVSNVVGHELTARYGLDQRRLAVVHSGVSRPHGGSDPAGVAARLGLGVDYLLCVGALEPRKEPLLLRGAYERARAHGLRAELAFAGSGRLARRLAGEGIHLLGQVEPEDLDALYAGALALVMPSRREGYGLPPLEALARGTPPVVSDLPVYDETVADAALRFPPGDPDALANALLRIAADGAERERLVERGRRALAGRTWEAAARRTRAVLAEAAAETRDNPRPGGGDDD